MEEFVKKDFEKLLKHNGLDAHRFMKSTQSDVCRVYDRNIEQIPVTVDLYSRYARIVDYSDSGLSEEDIIEIKDIVSRFLYVELSHVVFTEKKKRSGGEQHEKREESCPVEVKENGLSFECDLSLYADTGLFLDHVNTRMLVRESSMAKRVLNLFCYTGAFSVYAADGGAESVTSVDLSNVYSAWARRNLDKNGFLDKEKYEVIAMDAKAFLVEAIEQKRCYDLVIFDPPAFSNSHKAEEFDVQDDYLWFLGAISKVLSRDGAVVFSENLAGFRLDKVALSPYFDVREITRDVLALNFSSKRKGMRVWILEKTATVKEELKAVKKSRKMSEELKDESLDRLTLADDSFGNERRGERRERSDRKSYDFEERRSSQRGDRRGSYRGYERRDTHARDHERRSRDRFDERRSYHDRDDRRYSDRGRDFQKRDDFGSRRYERDSYRDRDRDDRRDDRRFSDRDDRYTRRDRDDSFRDRDRRYSREGVRRSGNFRSKVSGDNETSRFYREDRDDRRSSFRDRDRDRDTEGRKKTSKPKPYGYDSFMETKNREKATAFWLQGQEVADVKDED